MPEKKVKFDKLQTLILLARALENVSQETNIVESLALEASRFWLIQETFKGRGYDVLLSDGPLHVVFDREGGFELVIPEETAQALKDQVKAVAEAGR